MTSLASFSSSSVKNGNVGTAPCLSVRPLVLTEYPFRKTSQRQLSPLWLQAPLCERNRLLRVRNKLSQFWLGHRLQHPTNPWVHRRQECAKARTFPVCVNNSLDGSGGDQVDGAMIPRICFVLFAVLVTGCVRGPSKPAVSGRVTIAHPVRAGASLFVTPFTTNSWTAFEKVLNDSVSAAAQRAGFRVSTNSGEADFFLAWSVSRDSKEITSTRIATHHNPGQTTVSTGYVFGSGGPRAVSMLSQSSGSRSFYPVTQTSTAQRVRFSFSIGELQMGRPEAASCVIGIARLDAPVGYPIGYAADQFLSRLSGGPFQEFDLTPASLPPDP